MLPRFQHPWCAWTSVYATVDSHLESENAEVRSRAEYNTEERIGGKESEQTGKREKERESRAREPKGRRLANVGRGRREGAFAAAVEFASFEHIVSVQSRRGFRNGAHVVAFISSETTRRVVRLARRAEPSTLVRGNRGERERARKRGKEKERERKRERRKAGEKKKKRENIVCRLYRSGRGCSERESLSDETALPRANEERQRGKRRGEKEMVEDGTDPSRESSRVAFSLVGTRRLEEAK